MMCTLGEVETSGEWQCSRISASSYGTQLRLPCIYMSQHMHIARPNVRPSPACTLGTPDPARGRDALSVVQSEEEHFPLPRGHRVARIVAQRSATPEPVELSHDISPDLYSHCSSCRNATVNSKSASANFDPFHWIQENKEGNKTSLLPLLQDINSIL